jgi:hypothetical protein
MKRGFVVPVVLVLAATFAAAQVVHWQTIAGVITAPTVNSPVAGIPSGLFPWVTSGGQATADLANGRIEFVVRGLVLNGTNVSGTRGDISEVKGTLVCNPGTATQAVLDTAAVPLSPEGNAHFAGDLGTVPTPCSNPLFLIRISSATAANNRWIATGEVRITAGP